MLKLAYYVRRCKRRTGPERYKTLHCADTQKTFCGKFLNDGMWYIEESAGSIRREKPNPKDIEIVAIPKPYSIGLFEYGIATVVNKWQKIKGELPCKYTQRLLPEGIKLDLFFAQPENWGLIFAIRTGSADYSHKVLASTCSKLGYKSVNGMLTKDDQDVPIYEEIDLFKMLGLDYIEPKLREL